MVLDASLLNTQHCKVSVKGKWNNPRKGVAHPRLHLGVVVIEKGDCESANLLYISIKQHNAVTVF